MISGNHASGAGAGVYNDWPGAGAPRARQARHSVIVGNSADVGGGGIYDAVGATFTVTGSGVDGNWPDNCEPAASVTGCKG